MAGRLIGTGRAATEATPLLGSNKRSCQLFFGIRLHQRLGLELIVGRWLRTSGFLHFWIICTDFQLLVGFLGFLLLLICLVGKPCWLTASLDFQKSPYATVDYNCNMTLEELVTCDNTEKK